MMKCDLQRGYCLDGRLPCDLCNCFMPVTRTLKRISRPLHNNGSCMKLVYATYPLRVKKRKATLVGSVVLKDLIENVGSPVKLDVSSLARNPVRCSETAGLGRIKGFIQATKELICKHKGHDWETYAYSTGFYAYDVEQAGSCKRCGFDTHS